MGDHIRMVGKCVVVQGFPRGSLLSTLARAVKMVDKPVSMPLMLIDGDQNVGVIGIRQEIVVNFGREVQKDADISVVSAGQEVADVRILVAARDFLPSNTGKRVVYTSDAKLGHMVRAMAEDLGLNLTVAEWLPPPPTSRGYAVFIDDVEISGKRIAYDTKSRQVTIPEPDLQDACNKAGVELKLSVVAGRPTGRVHFGVTHVASWIAGAKERTVHVIPSHLRIFLGGVPQVADAALITQAVAVTTRPELIWDAPDGTAKGEVNHLLQSKYKASMSEVATTRRTFTGYPNSRVGYVVELRWRAYTVATEKAYHKAEYAEYASHALLLELMKSDSTPVPADLEASTPVAPAIASEAVKLEIPTGELTVQPVVPRPKQVLKIEEPPVPMPAEPVVAQAAEAAGDDDEEEELDHLEKFYEEADLADRLGISYLPPVPSLHKLATQGKVPSAIAEVPAMTQQSDEQLAGEIARDYGATSVSEVLLLLKLSPSTLTREQRVMSVIRAAPPRLFPKGAIDLPRERTVMNLTSIMNMVSGMRAMLTECPEIFPSEYGLAPFRRQDLGPTARRTLMDLAQSLMGYANLEYKYKFSEIIWRSCHGSDTIAEQQTDTFCTDMSVKLYADAPPKEVIQVTTTSPLPRADVWHGHDKLIVGDGIRQIADIIGTESLVWELEHEAQSQQVFYLGLLSAPEIRAIYYYPYDTIRLTSAAGLVEGEYRYSGIRIRVMRNGIVTDFLMSRASLINSNSLPCLISSALKCARIAESIPVEVLIQLPVVGYGEAPGDIRILLRADGFPRE